MLAGIPFWYKLQSSLCGQRGAIWRSARVEHCLHEQVWDFHQRLRKGKGQLAVVPSSSLPASHQICSRHIVPVPALAFLLQLLSTPIAHLHETIATPWWYACYALE